MRHYLLAALCVAGLFPFQTLLAQSNDIPCGADIFRENALQDPQFAQKHEAFEQQILQIFEHQKDVAGQTENVKVVPVVVHIIHDGGPENISDAQVQQAIIWLNQALANQGNFNQGSGTDCEIQLCLAQRTPNEQATNGITRNQSPLTEMQMESQDLQVKNLNRWNPNDYLNIWLVRSICSTNYGCGVYGYANYPFAHGSNIDGIVIEAAYLTELGKISGLAHETGHYFGLYHTFEGGCNNNNCLTQGDRICDTPPDQSTAGVPCDQSVNTCSTDTQSGPFATDQPDMSWNFMDYGIIACFHDFTPNQSTRMNATLETVRKSLLVSKGCLPPCTTSTVASFSASSVQVAMGLPVNFTNTSQNAGASEWLVDGVPFSAQSNAAYTFPAPGTYTITLNVTPANSTLCYPDQAQLLIEVFCPVTADYTLSNVTPDENETIYLNNTSLNSTENQWFINGIGQGNTLDSVNFSSPGAYEIRLITSNGVCGDTVTEFVYVLGVCLNKTFESAILTDYTITSAKTVTILADGHLLVAGHGTSPGLGSAKFFAKMKPDGTVVWFKKTGDGNASGQTMTARATPDGGFVALWGEGFLNTAVGDWYLAKYDANGVSVWSKKFDWNNQIINDLNTDIVVNPDGSFVMSGPFLARFLSDGTPVWAKDIPDVIKVIRHPNGGYLLLRPENVTYINELGALIWNKQTVTPPYTFSPLDITVLPNWEIYVSGIEMVNPNTIWHGVLIKLNAQGNLVWAKKYRQSPVSTYQFESITPTLAGNLMVAGYARAADPGPANFNDYHFMLELDLDGNILSTKHRPNKINVNDLVPSPGGGYIMAGGESFWTLKTNERGETPGCQDSPHSLQSFDFDFSSTVDNEAIIPILLVQSAANVDLENINWSLDSICDPACLQTFEICNNNLDDDGDGLFDCLDSECACTEDKCDPKQSDIWYFGFNAGLDFHSDPPTLLGNGKGSCHGISATMCDVQGRLLFYTDGQKVYNRFHQPMPNGTFLLADSVLQSIIVPNPANANQFYVFVSYHFAQTVYSLVDMTLQGGSGDVVSTQKNVAFSPLSSGLAAVKACSFSGYWLLTRTIGPSSFKAFRIDQNGLNPTPVTSTVGQNAAVIQQLKFSPDGKRIACTHLAQDTNLAVLSIFDFDPYTSGVVSNPQILSQTLNSNKIWGAEFSPNGRFLYATGAFASNVKLVQYDLNAGDLAAIQASRVKLATLPGQGFGYPQLTPQGRIYMTGYDNFTPLPYYVLSVVNQPDQLGLASQFQYESLEISDFAPSGGAGFGLNNVIASYFTTPQTPKLAQSSLDTICALNTPIFYQIEDVQCGVDSITWVTENLDVQIAPNYQYATIRYLSPGSGRLIVTAYTPCGKATDTLNILVVAPLNQTIDLGPDLVVCQNGVFSFNAGSGFARYLWSDGTADSTVTTLFPGTYWVKAWDLCGNLQTDSITVSIAPNSVLDLGPDLPQQCSGFSVNYQRPANFESWSWSPADFLSCTDCPNVTVSPNVSASWVVIGQTENGCISIDTLSATIRDTLIFNRDTSVCVGETLALFGVQLPADTTAEFFLPALGAGCDTLLTVNVLGVDNSATNLSVRICADAFYTYNGQQLPADTVAVFHFNSVLACDSVVTLTVNAFPALNLSLPQDTTIRIGASVLLEAETTGTGNLDFAWSPGDGLSCVDCPDPLASPLDTITYTLAVTDANGCTAEETVTVRVNEECRVRFPNAFTPNGDGANDVFQPILDPCVRTVRLWKIINRWGQPVYEQINLSPSAPNLGWDGRWDGKPHASDVLIWVAEVEYFDGRRESWSGEVTLVR